MAETYGKESEDLASHKHGAELDLSPEREGRLSAGRETGQDYPASLLGDEGTGLRGNAPVRQAVMQRAQQTHGNRSVQRVVQRVEAAAPNEQEEVSKTIENINTTMEFGKNASSMMLGETLPKGFGFGMDMLGETLKRGGAGQGGWETMGGTLTKGLGAMFGESEMLKEAVGESSKGFNIANLVGSGMKMVGAMTGEKDDEVGVGKLGEAVSTGATLTSAPALVAQGVQEGTMDLYNTAQGVGDWMAGGGTGKLLQQGEDQLKGKSGTITQGYSMIADLIGGAATGTFGEEAGRIGHMADKGELGALPLLGSKLGDVAYDVSEVAGAGFGMIGDALTGNSANIKNRQELMAVNNPLGKAVNKAGSWLGDKAFDMLGPSPKWMQDLF